MIPVNVIFLLTPLHAGLDALERNGLLSCNFAGDRLAHRRLPWPRRFLP
jgi:hypothetical protein